MTYQEKLKLIKLGIIPKECVPKARKPIAKKSAKRIEQDKLGRVNGSDDEMDSFWKNAEKVISKKPYCWECNDFIFPSDYRNATAHIMPKSENSGFPSVASNQWNFVVAGVRCGCHNKTHRLDTFSQMSIFPTAVNRFMKFKDQITEKRKYLDLFIEYANEII